MEKRTSIRIFSLGLILSMVSLVMSGQAITVKGTVVSAIGSEPLPGTSVLVKGTANGTVTDIDGKFTIGAKKGDVLIFSFVGFITQEVKITGPVMNITMAEETALLEECVVVGYGTEKKRSLTGTIAQVFSRETRTVEMSAPAPMYVPYYHSQDEYQSFTENRFHDVRKDPLSTFSIDVDVAGYGQMRRHINNGQLPPVDAIRTEELINYFSYQYQQPKGKDPVSLSAEVGECPWNKKHRLVKIGVKAREIAGEELPASNFVFLIDVSGSMYGPTRLDLVKSSLKLLVNNLRDKDRVAIVVYAGYTAELLPSTSGKDKQKIREVIDGLEAGGGTAGSSGIQMAYRIAEKNFVKGGNNRIILCTDGDFNVGVSSPEGLQQLVEEKRKTGVFLTVLGYGMGNYKDKLMQILAEKGNGNYAYIDNLQEANKVLVTEFGGTLFTVAKDVKLQIEFNPGHVQAYRLVGYESRLLNDEDFNDDTKDAGEMGAGHTVTALYEVIPAGVESSWQGSVDPLKYQKNEKKEVKEIIASPELLTVKLRYKDPDSETSKKMEMAVNNSSGHTNSSDFLFASAVAMFGQLLRNSQFKGDATYKDVIALANRALDHDDLGYRREFIRLVDTAQQLTK